ncbi:MAG: NADH-quinone oxidoreductase subunit L [Fibromonadaceae bacterium]|jgi:NADH-quinone oxidoreductase subunit L|nr:NADH-quinone oxidoreductase subunit L [Fibromonadaceae bacterium]
MTAQIPLWVIPAFPLLGAILLGVIALARTKSEQPAPEAYIGALAVFFPLCSFVLTVIFALGLPNSGLTQQMLGLPGMAALSSGSAYAETLGTWIAVGNFKITFGFLFDSLAKVMLLFITGITTLIVLYSLGYMKGDKGYTRFLCYLNLFLFSMIVLVLADSLPLTFLGWEGVGLCSYLLVGFWNKDRLSCKAANKAFLVNRVGDVGFLLGMLVLIAVGGTTLLNYANLNEWLLLVQPQGALAYILALAALFLFFACTGKSAQIPLLTWLPDAMAGPTPVSALIHAATMVTAGIYLMARLAPLFVFSPGILDLVLLIAVGTALWAAVTGLMQHDIKKVLAYSTISQLGFMFMAVGAGAFNVAIFHVFTHAFTKAALFLGAGSVMHALGGEQDIRKMGGLAKKLPSTFLIMLLAWASLIGLPGLACFWSKDLILESLRFEGAGSLLFYVAVFTAFLTAVYMTRLMVLVFFGKFRGTNSLAEKTHESPIVMQIPMWILAVGCVFAGYTSLFRLGDSTMYIAVLGSGAAILGLVFAGIYFSKKIPKYSGHSELAGFVKTWTFAFDTLNFIAVILPVRIAALVLGWVNDFLRLTMQMVAAIPHICAGGLRFMQANKLRMQLALTILCVVILVYWLLIFIR